MTKRLLSPVAMVATAILFMMSFMLGAQALSAQGTATPGDMAGMADGGHPAHIHSGTCANLGAIEYPLNNLTASGATVASGTPMDMMGSPAAGSGSTSMNMASSPEAGYSMGSTSTPVAGMGQVAAQSTTTVDASLDDLTSGEYAVNVHESVENIQNYIACGEITGTATNGQLQIQLQELNGSGFVGEAHFTDNGDGTTTVMVTLSESGMGMTGTPEASPSS